VLSPGGRTISLELNETGRIIEAHDEAHADAHDNKGHRISYLYDDAGRLAAVRDDGALAVRYAYDDHNMLAVFDGAGKLLVQNRYSGDRVAQQRLANGKVYGFRYIVARSDDAYVVQTIVTLPDQSQVTFNFRNGVLLTGQRNLEPTAR
jgi:uncharacterized protein RhaS with RHS repeats